MPLAVGPKEARSLSGSGGAGAKAGSTSGGIAGRLGSNHAGLVGREGPSSAGGSIKPREKGGMLAWEGRYEGGAFVCLGTAVAGGVAGTEGESCEGVLAGAAFGASDIL